ncbi:hypothetical protein KCU78_g3203, partial [Aureobasidium melanogenum]
MMLFRKPPTWILYTGRVGGLRLLSLPNEVLAMVCANENLSANDLAAMRLTCRELHDVTTKEFAQRYFQDPFVMMLRESLEALVNICKHPVFGSYVRKIQLLNNFFRPDGLEVFAGEMAYAYSTKDVAGKSTARRQMECSTYLVAEQHDLLDSDAGLELLTQAFGILGAQGKSVAIASQKFDLPFRPIGWSKVAGDIPQRNINMILGEPEVLLATNILLSAARAGACVVTKLVVGVDLFLDSYREQPSRSQLDKSSLRNLLEFNFDFEWQNLDGRQSDLAYEHLACFLQTLPQNLKTLGVYPDAEVKRDTTETHSTFRFLREALRFDALKNMRPNALENIHLGKVFLQQNNLLLLLKIHRKTLKNLVLSEVYLAGDWDQVLFHIAERSSLNHFILYKAFKVAGAQDHPYYPNPASIKLWYSKTCDLEESDGIRQGLEKFVELQEAERRADEAERQAKEAALRARALERQMNKRAAPSRRSSRIASQSAADSQKEETEG